MHWLFLYYLGIIFSVVFFGISLVSKKLPVSIGGALAIVVMIVVWPAVMVSHLFGFNLGYWLYKKFTGEGL